MTKPPKVAGETKPSGAAEKPDDLEITSIGSLYTGPWDKKYWSSSRGKDRYPYPVGYQAVRAHNGSTYKMEIQEGPKGPLFSIICADGQSCSGQTPDMAWEKFQKKFFPRLKIWHGKRFSCKIDGVEFFGFKNPFVQRLLREMAANVNGTAERSLLPLSFCNRASGTDVDNHSPEPCSFMASPRITGKRSRRRELVNSKSFSSASIKRSRPEYLASVAEASKGKKRYHNNGKNAVNEDDICKYQKVLPPLPAHQEESEFSAKDSLPLDSAGVSNHLRKDADHEDTRLFTSSGNCKSTGVASNLSANEDKPLDRSQDANPMELEDKNVDATVPKDSEGLTDVGLYAPDTFDLTQDKTSDSAPTIQDRSALKVVIPEGLLTESHQKVSPPLVHLVPAHHEESDFSAKDSLPLDSVCFSNHLRKDSAHEEARLLVGSGSCKSTVLASNLPVDEEKPCDRSQDFNLMAPEDKNMDSTIPKDSEALTDLCAPDTLDFTQDNTSESASTIQDRSALNVVISEGLVTESHPEQETDASKPNASSEINDFDSVGEEMAKSMMTFLLPQAIPLLKKGSRKEKGTVSPSEILPCMLKSQEEINETSAPSTGAMLAATKDAEEEGMYTLNSDLGSIVPIRSIVPDSLEGDQYGDRVVNHNICSTDKAEADEDSSDDACLLNSYRQVVSVNKHNKSLDDHLEINGSKYIMDSTGRLEECDTYISGSLSVCTSPHNRVVSEEIRDEFANRDGCSLGVIQSKQSKETSDNLPEAIDVIEDNQRGMLNSSKTSENENADKRTVAEIGNESFNKVSNLVYTRRKVHKGNYSAPFSESIVCRNNGDICVPESYPSTETLLALETLQMGSSDDTSNKRDSFCAEAKIGGHSSCLNAEKPSTISKGPINSSVPAVLQDQALVGASGENDTSYSLDLPVSRVENHVDKDVVEHENLLELNNSETSQKQGMIIIHDPNSIPHHSDSKSHSMEFNKELVGNLEFVGCYSHQSPVLSALLSAKGTETYVCVLCGHLVDKDGSLFIYKIQFEGPSVGCPSFVGHTSVTWPMRKDYFGKISLERSSLQFTPDGRCLVLLDSIKTPYCRQGSINCSCSTCTSNRSEENTVKIVEVKLGYVSVVARLKAVDSLECILVCKPNNIVAVGESGRLHLWVMNSMWSAQIENYVLPAEDCISPGIVELKRTPNCTHIVVGHNGCGEFSLWDISKRILVSTFSASSTSVCQFIPVSLFTWQIQCPVSGYSDIEEHLKQMMPATCDGQFSLEGEDLAVWLLVSSSSDFDSQDYMSGDCDLNPVGRWRLALTVKNTMIFGSTLDPRAAVVGASAGQGICGTSDGLVYTWELSTGTKIGDMHQFNGGRVSCIATDDSRSGAVAVACDNRLLVYMHSEKQSVN
ncbi:uncharacterized protein LOC126606259 isoform X1 [Malus sylvestris]|uniref:uncharacterized protein LOC126606259 isoform X1 n=1 Tax=Malus sylvestris TaxID=3752 RepID=UPI0021ABEDA5|nr:uncharacterized protein LOC126606259 isoform X1 [Malus sylvestris]XP_050129575.1 uncharacterized protein LOC126606259 isoform X1 [Malus sylvestris]